MDLEQKLENLQNAKDRLGSLPFNSKEDLTGFEEKLSDKEVQKAMVCQYFKK